MDPITLATLAGSAVNLLASFFGKASEGVAKKTGEAVFDTIKAKFSNHPDGQEALKDFEEHIENEDFAAVLRVQLQKSFQNDATFLSRIQAILAEAPQISSGNTINQTSGSHSTQYGYVVGNVTHHSKE